jgi:hypothetical protein
LEKAKVGLIFIKQIKKNSKIIVQRIQNYKEGCPWGRSFLKKCKEEFEATY